MLSSLVWLFVVVVVVHKVPDRYSDVPFLLRQTLTSELAAIHTYTQTRVIHSIGSKWSEKEKPVITSTASSTGLDSLSPSSLLEGFFSSFFLSFHSILFPFSVSFFFFFFFSDDLFFLF